MAESASQTSNVGVLLRASLEKAAHLRSDARRDAASEASWQRLRLWQSERLGRTYPDLFASAQYRDAAIFFQQDLYGPKDLTVRDREIERVVPSLVRLLPPAALSVIATALELDALSEELDAALARELGATRITDERYAAAYRKAGKRSERVRQIALIEEIGATLERVVRLPFLGTTLIMVGPAAHLAGFGSLHDFFQRGFNAFRKMRAPGHFISTVVTRETVLLERLYAKSPEPFKDIARIEANSV